MNLTQEQKAKRYDYLESCIFEFLQDKAQDEKAVDSTVRTIDVVNKWLDKVDLNDDIIPQGIYFLLDKILKESYDGYVSMKSCLDIMQKSEQLKYMNFEKKIGG